MAGERRKRRSGSFGILVVKFALQHANYLHVRAEKTLAKTKESKR